MRHLRAFVGAVRLSARRAAVLVALAPGASPALAQVELVPVDPGLADTSPLGASLRSLQADLRSPVGFDRVYGVSGRDDVWVRSSGALHAVFPRSWYEVGANGAVETLIPAGTTFRIGHDALEAALAPHDDGPGSFVVAPSAVPQRGSRLSATAWASPLVPEPVRAAPFATRLDGVLARPTAESSPSPPPPDAPRPLMAASARDDVDATGDASVKGPPILVDVDYRRRRLLELMRRAAQAARGPSSS